MRYVPAKTLYHLNKKLRLSACIESLKLLENDTFLISEKKYSIVDCHGGNILYDESYHVIDLDPGYFYGENTINTSTLMEANMKRIFCTIIDAIIGNKRYTNVEIDFYNSTLNDLYKETIYRSYHTILDFFENLQENVGKSNPTIHNIQRLKRSLYHHRESYYNKF